LKPASQHTVFLDRDGVINEDSPDYIKSWAELRLIPGSLEAIARLSGRGVRVFVVSNQSGIGRGLFSIQTLFQMHRNLAASAAAAGGRIDGFFFCPHRPEDGCACRKPRTGLIREACSAHDIDTAHAAMVGDSAKDIIAGRRAGCALSVLVRTGNGAGAAAQLAAEGIRPDHTAADLSAAIDWILDQWD
jgi:D-glycero-D-manno-heptose 1,7-bisphosphate phosphatase